MRTRITAVATNGPVPLAVAAASPRDQATTPGIQPYPPAVSTVATLPSLRSRRRRGRTPAAVWRAPAAAGPTLARKNMKERLVHPPPAV